MKTMTSKTGWTYKLMLPAVCCTLVVALAGCPASGAGGFGRDILNRSGVLDVLDSGQKETLFTFIADHKEEREAAKAHREQQVELLKSLNLTDEQREAIREVISYHREDLRTAVANLHDAKSALRMAVTAENPTEEAILAAAQVVGTASGDLALLAAVMVQDVRQILTPEQMTTLEALKANQEAWQAERIDSLPERIQELVTLADEIGLTEEQRDEIKATLLENHDERKERREDRRDRIGDRVESQVPSN